MERETLVRLSCAVKSNDERTHRLHHANARIDDAQRIKAEILEAEFGHDGRHQRRSSVEC